jgi:hypothetical protein
MKDEIEWVFAPMVIIADCLPSESGPSFAGWIQIGETGVMPV